MHIAVVSLGAFGHVNPTLELVTELVRRGVRVTYFCTEGFRTIVAHGCPVRGGAFLDGSTCR
jgi:UDP:flavonoid glycosyltransferase YjiC (YdhE family)